MCIENSGAYDPHSPAADRRLTLYWIGWAFFGVTITSIFIAGVMVSMYKMNAQDSMMPRDGYYVWHNMTMPKETNNNVVPMARDQPTPTPTHNRVPLHESDRSMARGMTNSNGHGDQDPKPLNHRVVMNVAANTSIAAGNVTYNVSNSHVSPPNASPSSSPSHHALDDDVTSSDDDHTN